MKTLTALRQREAVMARLSIDPPATDSALIKNPAGSFIASPIGHYHRLSPRHVDAFQRVYSPALTFTTRGLRSMRHKYDYSDGVPSFIRAILQLDVGSQELRALVQHPELSPYFPNSDEHGGFLVINNRPFDPQFETHRAPKAQKLRDDGIHLCAWFINPEEGSVTPATRALLHELTPGTRNRPMLQRLRAEIASGVDTISRSNGGGRKPNVLLPRPLTSILDLRAEHARMLDELQTNLRKHLQEAYGVDLTYDQVDIFCHWPYRDGTTTLHIQARVNQTIHPVDASNVFPIDELTAGLRQPGNTIDAMLMRRQKSNGGVFYGPKIDFSEFGKMDGITFSTKKNIFRLEANSHELESQAEPNADDQTLAVWLHDNRTFDIRIDGHLSGAGTKAVLSLYGKTYVVKRELARGCAATATLFERVDGDDQVVVKSLRNESIGKYQIVLYKEYNTLAHLDGVLAPEDRDKVVLPLGAVIDDNHCANLVFPFHIGGTVRNNVARLKRLADAGEIEHLQLTKLMMLDIASAKRAIESNDVVHVDPHDDNFILGSDGRARIIDFGCAEILPSGCPPLPRAILEQNLALPISYALGANLRPPADTEIGPLFDSFIMGVVFKNAMTPLVDDMLPLVPRSSECSDYDPRIVAQEKFPLFANLLNQMLDPIANRRPNADAILTHPFFDDVRSAESVVRAHMQKVVLGDEITRRS